MIKVDDLVIVVTQMMFRSCQTHTVTIFSMMPLRGQSSTLWTLWLHSTKTITCSSPRIPAGTWPLPVCIRTREEMEVRGSSVVLETCTVVGMITEEVVSPLSSVSVFVCLSGSTSTFYMILQVVNNLYWWTQDHNKINFNWLYLCSVFTALSATICPTFFQDPPFIFGAASAQDVH